MDLSKAKKIHEGKFSIVYLVEKGSEKFIIKQLHPRLIHSDMAVTRFTAEADLPFFEGVNSRTIDFKKQENHYYIIREFIPGMTLKEVQKKFRRKKNLVSYIQLYKELCEKIKVLHSGGYIHGDIKPSNILFSGYDFSRSGESVILLDLGLALKKDALPAKQKEAPLHFSMLYAAPELMLNEPLLVSECTDLFSLGICMYESLSGEVPYKENHPAVLLQMMLSVPLKRQKRIPEKLSELIMTLTAKPAFKRPIAHYTVDEARMILEENIVRRKSISSIEAVKTKLEEQ